MERKRNLALETALNTVYALLVVNVILMISISVAKLFHSPACFSLLLFLRMWIKEMMETTEESSALLDMPASPICECMCVSIFRLFLYQINVIQFPSDYWLNEFEIGLSFFFYFVHSVPVPMLSIVINISYCLFTWFSGIIEDSEMKQTICGFSFSGM